MKISLNVNNLQHIENCNIKFDLENRNIICITGKNGVGKTCLIKALYLSKDVSIFSTGIAKNDKENKLSPLVSENTNIEVCIEKGSSVEKVIYYYDHKNHSLDSNLLLRTNLNIELPIPNGNRFISYPKLSKIDKKIREEFLKNINQSQSRKPEIVEFLSKIYPNNHKFNNLVEVKVSNEKYYILPTENGNYIREDYFSSGEYFIINIYKMLSAGNNDVIIIDEIDISLDASAQVNLVSALNELCEKYNKKIIFTSHSIVILKTIYENLNESIYYMDNDNGRLKVFETSYGFVMGEMFGFDEYDKYIITEDIVLEKFIKFILGEIGELSLKKRVKTLYIGGADEVKDFIQGARYKVLKKSKKDIIAILDGDKVNIKLGKRILHIPFDNVESEIFDKCKGKEREYNLPEKFKPQDNVKCKSYYNQLMKCINDKFTYGNIVDILREGKEKEIDDFKENIRKFLEDSDK